MPFSLFIGILLPVYRGLVLMHVNSIEIEFSDDGIVAARTGIDFEDFELQRPVGLRLVVIAEGAHIKTLECAAVLQIEDSVGLAVVVHAQLFYTRIGSPSLLALYVSIENFHLRDARTFALEGVGQALANALALCCPHTLVAEIVGVLALVVKLFVGGQTT